MVTSKRFLLSLGVATILAARPGWAALPDIVRIEKGLVSGVSGGTPDMRVFKGIPYAAPPVGPLRWRPPQPVQRWEDVRKADQFGSRCMQPSSPGGGNRPGPAAAQTSMGEDCLYLNLWTAAASASDRRPVIVWSHGGAFTISDGSRYDGEMLARKGAVVITYNYRLGPFGFFAHPQLTTESGRNASGNYGLMDLFAVLRWVQQNIAAFGGDPNRVTLMGQSAGGLLIRAALASPQGKGLFHRAISQSAPVRIERMLTRSEAEKAGQEKASKIGASSLAELRAKPADEIQRGIQGGRLVIDGWYVTEDVSVTISEGRHNRVDLLIGSNKDEGTSVSSFPTSSFYGLGNASARQFADSASQRFGSKASAFLEVYPAGSEEQAKESQLAAMRDEAAWNARDWAMAQAKVGGGRAYLYYFVQEPPASPGRPPASWRATHGAEIPYAFNDPVPAWTEVDRTLADAMSSYWVNFAKNGNPNGPGLPMWPAIQAALEQVMILGPKIEVGQVLDSRRVTLFDFVAIRRSVASAR